MPTANPVYLLDKKFDSQKKFREFVNKLIYEEIGMCEDIKNIYPSKYKILIKVLERHPSFNKKSINMCNLKIIQNKFKTGLEVIIVNKDKTEVDISWNIAISGKSRSYKYDLMSAMRSSIDDQIYKLKKNKNKYCEKCGETTNLHIDHNDEVNSSFDELALNFINLIKDKKLKVPDEFKDKNDGTNRREFTEKNIYFKNKWKEYHQKNAKLRILCQTCNLSRPKSKNKYIHIDK